MRSKKSKLYTFKYIIYFNKEKEMALHTTSTFQKNL